MTMGPIKIEGIVSVSSEDAAHPASNLLKSEDSNVKWKCKTPGEKSISVVFRLAQPSKITGIDIGNENSALVEILVARSNEPEDYQVLLISSSLMTVQEAKYGENRNGVRMFKEENLSGEIAAQQWDRVKIVCSQPYVTYAPYGLSFVVFHGTSDGADEGSSVKGGGLGKFQLKDDDEDETLTPGLLFARRNDPSTTTPVFKIVSNSSKTKLPAAAAFVAKATKIDPNDTSDVPTDPLTGSGSQAKTPRAPRGSTKKDRKVAAVAPSTSRGSQPKKAKTSVSVKPFNKPAQKPFHRLFENVVFVISGFQNPYRSDIRSQALAMGAKYKADWDHTCTHLVCAFMNTPKFQQVHGRGKIVKKDWILESHARRRALPWRRFALDPRDQSQPESDEEIYEETTPVDSNRNATAEIDADSDSEGSGRGSHGKRPNGNRQKRKKPETAVAGPSTSNPARVASTSQITPRPDDVSIFDMDTEEEMDPKDYEELNQAASKTESTDDEEIPNLNSFFLGATFSILTDIDGDVRKKLRRYIIAHGGEVEEDTVSQDVEYVISEIVDEVDKIKTSRPDVYGVRPEWIWRCHDRDKLIPVCMFSL